MDCGNNLRRFADCGLLDWTLGFRESTESVAIVNWDMGEGKCGLLHTDCISKAYAADCSCRKVLPQKDLRRQHRGSPPPNAHICHVRTLDFMNFWVPWCLYGVGQLVSD